MELPFKYIVLSIIKTLNDRNMSLVISKSTLIAYLKELMNKSYFTIKEKREIGNNFNLDFELDDLFNKYYQYFDIVDDKIAFDEDYISELNSLINDEIKEYDIGMIYDINFVLNDNVSFLDILGVDIKKDLYNFLIDIEKEIEDCYNEISNLESCAGVALVDTDAVINKIKKFKLKKIIMLLNTKNLLSNIQYSDLILYAGNMADRINDLDDVSLLVEDEQFDESDIVYDVFLRCIFTGSDSYISNLRGTMIINGLNIKENWKNSRIKFYLMFLELLEREIDASDELLNIELIKIKYRIMNVLDSVYGTALFMNKEIREFKNFKEDYFFIHDAVYYFINELLVYDDEKYKNKNNGTDNVMVYLDNIMKKLLIETYYILTKDTKVIATIKDNKLYGINVISSDFLKDIVDKSKTKIKEK